MLKPDALTLSPEALERRFTWARRQGHPRYLWPDVPIEDWRDACETLAETATGLLTAPSEPPRLESSSPSALGVAAYTTGLGPWLGWHVTQGSLATSTPTGELLRTHYEHGSRRAERRLDAARVVIDALDQRDVPAVVLKGTHTALAHFPAPGTRVSTDIDLLVAPGDLDGATAVMRGLAYEQHGFVARPVRSEWRRPDHVALHSLTVHHADDGIAVDLHTSLARTFFGARTITPDDVPWTTSPLPALGERAKTLDHPHGLVLLLLHTSEDWKHLQLIKLVEIALVVQTDTATGVLDWGRVDALLDALDAWRFVYPACALTERLAPGTVAPDTLRRAEAAAPTRMKRIVARTAWGEVQQLHRVSLGSRFIWASTPGETLRTAAALAWPPLTTAEPWRRVLAERWYRLVRGTLGSGRG